MQITCTQPHTVSDVIFNVEKSDLTPRYATVESSVSAKANFHRPTCYVPGFNFICIFIFKYQQPTTVFLKET